MACSSPSQTITYTHGWHARRAAWAWHGWSAYQARAGFTIEQKVEDWIKSRYRLIGLYAIILVIGQIGSFIRIVYAGGPTVTSLGNAMGLLTLITQITAVILQFLVWVMPEGFRQWLNRNQQLHTEERNREQALVILDILGSAMSEGTDLPKLVALFIIRKAIGHKIHSEDSNKIEAHAITLGYNQWLDLLENPELHILIENSPAALAPRQVIDKAKRALIERQSLFTMQAK